MALWSNPLLSPIAIVIVALALSIGWGIRGNYGHETGAMLPGALAAIAACCLSGRADWRRRMPYFALFGALGWAFGGSISYMQVIGYTHSGQYESQLFGFYGLFAIGFLWAAAGGGATALPASLETRRLTDLVRSFIPLFALWCLLYLMEYGIAENAIRSITRSFHAISTRFGMTSDTGSTEASADAGLEPGLMSRHEDMLYWLDTDWFVVAVILAGIFLTDLTRRRFGRFEWLLLFAGLGAMIGVGVQVLLDRMEMTDELVKLIVHPQGDLRHFSPDVLPTNWPNFMPYVTDHIGWGVGLIAGILAYFAIFGRFDGGLSLYAHLAIGWYVGFLALPVLADIHMTPPRGDSWAGIAGLVAGGWIYFLRQRLWGPLTASIICGAIGGIGFSGTAWLKLILMSWGNPNLIADPAIREAWHHYQHANWHSFLEQTYGFINGIGIALALAVLARRVPVLSDEPRRRGMEIFSIAFALPVLAYVNLTKNLNDWTRGFPDEKLGPHFPVAKSLTAPLVQSIELSAWAWFSLFFWFVSGCLILLMKIHERRPIAIVPSTWLGRGQLLFLILAWVFVIGNWGKALVAFGEQRLLTEGVITFNAALATTLLLAFSTRRECTVSESPPRWWLVLLLSLVFLGVSAGLLPRGQTWHVRSIYGDRFAGHSGRNNKPNLRFGDEAEWRTHPNLRGEPHR